jgi:hypothetical protein
MDACGNQAQGVQTIQVVDRTAPLMTIPSDRTLECPANVSTNANGTATATDTCGQATVRYSDSVSNECGGTKILRREAIPLYVVVAESQPKPEAGRAVIFSRSTGKSVTLDLNDPAALNTLVQSGDVVTLTVRPPEFFYVGGEIGSPGQKDFHAGITLTQALLASGGVTKTAGDRVRVSRQGADGRLVSTEYNLREIENGAVPDPALRPGDRIEVSTAVKRK